MKIVPPPFERIFSPIQGTNRATFVNTPGWVLRPHPIPEIIMVCNWLKHASAKCKVS